jgi:DNA polymerase I-like protein with 3'-5' exonuclease and polymerase domains
MEADFSQLEVIGLAFLSNDKNLRYDILAGVDMHCRSAEFLTGEKYETIYANYKMGDEFWTKTRKKAKGPSFQLQYGAGIKAIAENCGLSIEEAKAFVSRYYDRYSGVKEWQEYIKAEVQAAREPTDAKTPKGFPRGKGTYHSCTGRMYTFHEYDAPDWVDLHTSFSPTEIKNYPVQGFATGDIVPLVLGKLFNKYNGRNDVLLINTVHDSILFDTIYDPDSAEVVQVAQDIKDTLEKAPQYLKDLGVNFDLPLSANVEWGRNWGELHWSI